ncbi:unnamed protein product [Penicillium salamii]|uniref:WKF domain-containing protein n=1 Tax=Penicillium salamii TaxID=1612424 RepID=A0A9W4IBP1_9EURO|nr:unnamed protein product [Penicillium salamii]CAG7997900.1 unnamed protein product [Penicillium salamii]CAG8075895.1 unnamed protein product [Penicillium salamii]CAG8252755.1 unnamed protein product [Penicillium salamii]CAG8265391.1 unnamed protein product [Penicillium salamii]
MAHAETQSPASKKLESRPKKAKDSPSTEDDTKLEKKDKKKRKKSASDEVAPETDGELKKKKKRRHTEDDDEQKDKDTESHKKKKKRVSFGPGTKENDGDSDSDSDAAESTEAATDGAEADIEDKEADKALEEMKKRKREKKKQRKTGTASAEGQIHETPILSYLSHYHRARETWKFQKNRETNLFKHLYSLEHVPARYNTSLLNYVQGLKGDAAKQRMSDAARDVIKADMDVDKPKDDEEEETTNPAYLEAVNSFRELLSEGSEELDSPDVPEGLNGDAQKRLPKRQRGELVFFAVTGKLFSAEDAKPKPKPKVVEPPANKKRKNRTMVVDISSSEDSDDDTSAPKKSPSKPAPDSSDDDTSSSGSSSDSSSDSDDSDAPAPAPAPVPTPAKQTAPTPSGPSEVVSSKKNAKKQKFVPEKKEPVAKVPKKTQKRKLRTAQIEISSSESDSE